MVPNPRAVGVTAVTLDRCHDVRAPTRVLVSTVLGLGLLPGLVAGLDPGGVLPSAGAEAAPGAFASPVAATATPAVRGLHVAVVSTRADLVSGGDALIEVRSASPRFTVRAGGRDVTRVFRSVGSGRHLGLVDGLPLGRTTITATAAGRSDRVVVVNHPAGGPVLSGPQTRHYRCPEGTRTPRCEAPARYDYLYRSTDPTSTGLQPYDPADPPSDVATTTTDAGVEVPFVVRREQGYLDRDRYTILTLFRPGKAWTAAQPQPQWNHKVLVPHGGGCGVSYTAGDAPLEDFSGTFDGVPTGSDPTYVTALGRGFAVLSTALDNTGHACSVTLNAESVLMAKERLVERYGTIRYTIGTGCSGGSIAQHTVANAYPGIYQGLVTTCSYPDAFSPGAQFADYHLLRLYFEDPSRWGTGVLWSPTQMAAVEGHLSHVNAVVADEGLFKAALNPTHACPGTLDPVKGDERTRYDALLNPGGVRCSVLDLVVNQLGRRPRSEWSKAEKAAGRGFGGMPFGNRGILYGLSALSSGLITPAQFVDLNEKIGGLDLDENPIADRTTATPSAIRRAYRTGLVNEMTHLRDVAIINFGGPDPGLAHDYSHAFWTEERMLAAQGHTDNRVMWFGPAPLIGLPSWANEAFDRMDAWLSAVEADARPGSLAARIVRDRPADVTDRCLVADLNPVCSIEELRVLQTDLSTPRQEAGGPVANDVMQCALRPLKRSDVAVGPLSFLLGDAEFARLQQVFPDGVCDWSKPGMGQGPTVTWLRYDAPGGGVVYGGRPLPAAVGGAGLVGPAFREGFSGSR